MHETTRSWVFLFEPGAVLDVPGIEAPCELILGARGEVESNRAELLVLGEIGPSGEVLRDGLELVELAVLDGNVPGLQ